MPKFAQRIHPLLRRIAGDDCRVDGADRDSGNPIGMQIDLGQRLINSSRFVVDNLEVQSRHPEAVPGPIVACHRSSEVCFGLLLAPAQYLFNSLHDWHFEILFIVAIICHLTYFVLEGP